MYQQPQQQEIIDITPRFRKTPITHEGWTQTKDGEDLDNIMIQDVKSLLSTKEGEKMVFKDIKANEGDKYGSVKL